MQKEKVNTVHLEIYPAEAGDTWDSPIGVRVKDGVELFTDKATLNYQGKEFCQNH